MKRRNIIIAGGTSLTALTLGFVYKTSQDDPGIFLSEIEASALMELLPNIEVLRTEEGPVISQKSAKIILDRYHKLESRNVKGILVF